MKRPYAIRVITLSVFAFLAPLYAFGAARTFKELVSQMIGIINILIPIIFAFAFVVFIWGVFWYLFFPDRKESLEDARNLIVWGLVAFVTMVSVWGILNILHRTFL